MTDLGFRQRTSRTRSLVIALALCLWGCASLAVAEEAKRLLVFASVLPVQYFVERVGGDDVRAEVMVLPGQSPHTYEPRPQQIAALAEADLYVRVGVAFENAWMRRIQAANPRMPILDLRDGLALRPIEPRCLHGDETDANAARQSERQGAEQDALDPHIWTNPRIVREMIERLRDQLSVLDPANAQAYAARQAAFDEELQALDAAIEQRLHEVKERAFLVYHPAWGYFADAYGLRQIPVEFEGKEPGARQLAALIEQARAQNIRVVLVQPQFNQRAAKRVAQAIGGQVIGVDPLAFDYAANMRRLAEVIAAPATVPSEH